MKCPKCRSEVGNQQVCPYCGSTVYINGNSWTNANHSNGMPGQQNRLHRADSNSGRDCEQRLRILEKRINMMLVVQLGLFVITVLILVVLALV